MRAIGTRVTVGVAVVLFGAAAGAEPSHMPAAVQVSFAAPKAVPFELFRDQRVFLAGTVNGRPTPMMLDSGAVVSVIDKAFARQLGLPPGEDFEVRGATGSVPGKIVTGVNLSAGSLNLKKVTVLVMDMGPVAAAIGRPIPVVLGREAFAAGLVTVDFPHHKIAFSDRARFMRPAATTEVKLGERSYGVKTVPISIGGMAPIEADLDLGNSGSLLIANALWKDDSGLKSLRHAAAEVGGVGGMKPARKVMLPNVTLAGHRYSAVPAIFNEDAQSLPRTGANVGIGMLKPFVVTFDFPGNSLYLSGPRDVKSLPRERAGMRLQFADGRLKIAYVSPDGPAALAGLKSGDEIASIDGRKVASDYYSRPDWQYGRAGREVRVERADGTRVQITLADYY